MFLSLSDNTCANDVIDNDVTENDVIDSWMNMHTLLASRPNVVKSTRARTRSEVWTGLKFTTSQLQLHYHVIDSTPMAIWLFQWLAWRSGTISQSICMTRSWSETASVFLRKHFYFWYASAFKPLGVLLRRALQTDNLLTLTVADADMASCHYWGNNNMLPTRRVTQMGREWGRQTASGLQRSCKCECKYRYWIGRYFFLTINVSEYWQKGCIGCSRV